MHHFNTRGTYVRGAAGGGRGRYVFLVRGTARYPGAAQRHTCNGRFGFDAAFETWRISREVLPLLTSQFNAGVEMVNCRISREVSPVLTFD